MHTEHPVFEQKKQTQNNKPKSLKDAGMSEIQGRLEEFPMVKLETI